MVVTPTGIALIALGLLLLLLAPRRLMAALIFFSSFSSTAVINFSNYGMAPAVVFLALLLLWKLLGGEALDSVRMSKDQGVAMFLIAGFGAASVVSLVANQLSREVLPIQVTQTAYVLFGIAITLALSIEMLRGDRLESAISALRAAASFIALWGILQAACHYAGAPYPAAVFNNSTSHFADMFDQHASTGTIRIASVATEPSFMAVSLMIFGSFGATLLAVEPRLRIRAWIIPVALTLLVVMASTSSTGYVGLGVLALLLARRRPGLMLALGACLAVAGSALLTLLPAFRDALYEFTFDKAASGSYIERSGAVWDAFNLFGARPLLGLGWGGNFSFSIVSTLLANVGLVGTLVFAAAVLATLLASRAARLACQEPGEWRLRAYAEGTENAMIVYMAVSLISGFHFVVADFWCLWAIALAAPSALARASRDASAMRHSTSLGTRMAVGRLARRWKYPVGLEK